MISLLAVILATPPASQSILFIGNSHTSGHDVPGMVRQLAENDGSGRRVRVEASFVSFLEDSPNSPEVVSLVRSKRWSAIFLQGLKLSSSHQYQYDHTGAVTIAKLAKLHSDKPYFFIEWPRRGWNEAEWIVGEYTPVSKASDVPMAKAGMAWPGVIAEFPNLSLWASDGNHSSLEGAYLAACGLYYRLYGDDHKPSWKPASISAQLASRLRAHAKNAVLP